jgi:tetratricopeptide (TPR) repeat protein
MTRKYGFAFIGLVIATVSFSGCFKSKTEVNRVPTAAEIAEGKKSLRRLDGVPYRLPRTVIQVSLPVKKVHEEPGPFVKFAPCFFTENDLSDLVIEKSTKFSLQAPAFSTLGEPDPDESYIVKIKGGYFENKSLLMDYTPAGILTKGEAESKDESLEFTLKAIKTATSIAGALSGITRLRAEETVIPEIRTDKQEMIDRAKKCYRIIDRYAQRAQQNAQQEEAAAYAQLDAQRTLENADKHALAVKKLQSLQREFANTHQHVETVSAITGTSLTSAQESLLDDYQQAENAYQRIIDMQNNRQTLVSTSANVNQETFNRLLEETDKTIDAYRAVFLGLSTEKGWKGVFTYRPTKADSQLSLPFFAFSSRDGLCEIGLSMNQGQHIPPAFKNEKCDNIGSLKGVWLLVRKDQGDDDFRRRIAEANRQSLNSEGTRGWHYRIPAKAVAYVMTAKMSEVESNPNVMVNYFEDERSTGPRFRQFNEVARSDVSVAQLGIVASIPASAAGRTNQASITLDESTGALRNFKYSSTSLLEKSMLEDVEGASKDIIDAKDSLKRKKRELDLLKTEKDIRDARKALENSNSGPPQ